MMNGAMQIEQARWPQWFVKSSTTTRRHMSRNKIAEVVDSARRFRKIMFVKDVLHSIGNRRYIDTNLHMSKHDQACKKLFLCSVKYKG
jgi:hypothetical protein